MKFIFDVTFTSLFDIPAQGHLLTIEAYSFQAAERLLQQKYPEADTWTCVAAEKGCASYYDPRTGGHTYGTIVFDGQEGVESFSPDYFERNSESITLTGFNRQPEMVARGVTGLGEFARIVTGWESQS